MKQVHTGAKIRCVCLMEKNKCSLNMGVMGVGGESRKEMGNSKHSLSIPGYQAQKNRTRK